MGSKSSEAESETKQPTVTFRNCFAEEPTDGTPFDPFSQAHVIQNPDKRTYQNGASPRHCRTYSDVQMTGVKCTVQLRQHDRKTRPGAVSRGTVEIGYECANDTQIACLPVSSKPRSYRTSCALEIVHLTREVSTRQFPRKIRDSKAVRSST
jgi:hypothetical protein